MPIIDDVHTLRLRHAKGWGWIVAYGLLLLAIGVMALLRPFAASFATGFLLGILLVMGGLLSVIAGFANRGWHSRWLDFAIGILSLVLGAIVLRNPIAGAFSLVWLIGFWAITIGVLELCAAYKMSFSRGWLALLGLVNLLLGAALLMAGPVTDFIFLALVVGISFTVRGVLLILFGWNLRKALGS